MVTHAPSVHYVGWQQSIETDPVLELRFLTTATRMHVDTSEEERSSLMISMKPSCHEEFVCCWTSACCYDLYVQSVSESK